MNSFFARRGAAYINEMNRSCGALLGIAQGLLCDRQLTDQEISFLNDWLTQNEEIACSWPGDVIHARVKSALSDGVITEHERTHLVETLQQLVGGTYENLAAATHVTELACDQVSAVEFLGMRFCLTGDFAFGPRETCRAAIETRGGIFANTVTKMLRYLVIGGLGSPEWKHGSFGTKIDKAVKYKREGVPILIVHEECWSGSLKR
jgi:NAD-dependent DNA ligase